MKKLFVSVGLAAVSASTLHAQYAPTAATQQQEARPWSLAATLRGFYDDNFLTLPNGAAQAAYGTEFSPSVSMHQSVDQTSYTVSYVYDIQYYMNQSTNHNTTDQMDQLNAVVNHTFSERYSMKVSDSFIYSSEPTVLNGSALAATPLRTSGDNIHNTGQLSGTAELTKELSLQGSYGNNFYSYQQALPDVYNPGYATSANGGLSPSRSGLLDRDEHLVSLNLDWTATPQTTAIAGYQFGATEYSSDEPIAFGPGAHGGATGAQSLFIVPGDIYSKSRDNYSDYFYVGGDQAFRDDLHGSLRLGAQYMDYYNADDTEWSPYVDASVTWQYAKASYVTGGIKNQHSATDVVGNDTTVVNQHLEPVLDSETTAAYVSAAHQLGDLSSSVLGQWQHSDFNGGSVNGQKEDFMILGMNLSFKFSPYLNGELGYNWNKLVSDVSGRDYTRNIVYVGFRAVY